MEKKFQATFWRLPANMTAAEMRKRAEIIQNYITRSEGIEDDFGKLLVSDSETEDGFNPTNATPVNFSSDDDNDANVNNNINKSKNVQSESKKGVFSDTEMNTQNIRSRLNELLDSDDSDDDSLRSPTLLSANTKGMKRRRLQAFDSDSDKNEDMENSSSIEIQESYINATTGSGIAAKKIKQFNN